jgi:hypothetical protein
MKRNILIICVTILILLVSLVSKSQASDDSKFRLGLQGTHFVGGLSGVVDFSNPWAIQGVLDFGADAFAFRVLNRFHEEQYWNAYLNGTLAVWGDDHRYWRSNDHYYRDHYYYASDIGVGVGIGVEYDWRGLEGSLPPIGWNIELGASVIPHFDLDIGIGVHWKF